MNKILHFVAASLLFCSSFASATTSDAPPAELAQIERLQENIAQDIQQLKQSKGDLKSLVEFRISNNIDALRAEIERLISVDKPNVALLTPLIEQQLVFVESIEEAEKQSIKALEAQLGTDKDAQILLKIAHHEAERIRFYQAQLRNFTWAERIGLDPTAKAFALVEILNTRGADYEMLVNFLQKQINQLTDKVQVAGINAEKADLEKLQVYKTWLKLSNQGLQSIIELLETMQQPTAELKKTLFQSSGDITQDVLTFAVLGSLVQQWMSMATDAIVEHGPSILFKVIMFFLILLISSYIARLAERFVAKAVSASKLDLSRLLQDFFIKLSSKIVYAIGLLVALSQMGVELGPLLAGFGIAGVIIGFALQETLSNFASGMMILIYRPFDVGDLVSTGPVTGVVDQMSLVSTTIKTLDNQRLIVPNNKIWGDIINNITVESKRRVDMMFSVSYEDNLEVVEQVLTDIVLAHPAVLEEPKPMVKVHNLTNSSVDFIVRPWSTPDDYWTVYWDVTRKVKEEFDAKGISIPYPQQDVYVHHVHDGQANEAGEQAVKTKVNASFFG